MNTAYTFHPHIIMRAPRKYFRETINEHFQLANCIADNAFMEAVYLASPILYEELLKYANGTITDSKEIQKLEFSLAKYYLRMSNRCTPFGLFSGCTTATWHNGNTDIVIDKSTRHTRFDMHYLCALAQHFASLDCIKDKILYFPNSSYYTLGVEIRYVEYKYINAKRHHLISAVHASEYLTAILTMASGGIKKETLVQFLVNEEIELEEATTFVNELIDSQLLVNELEPAITGDEFLYQIIATLKKINNPHTEAIDAILSVLEKIATLMQQIDEDVHNDITLYHEIIKLIEPFKIPFEASKLFQTDLSFTLQQNKLDAKLQTEIMDALDIVNKLNKPQENGNLQTFAKRFYERYEDAEMPLLEVLDTETGIGYLEGNKGNILPLVDDMIVYGQSNDESQIIWSKRDKYLLKKIMDAAAKNEYTVSLDENDLADFKNDWSALPASIAVMYRLLDDGAIFIESAGGSSAVNLLGRFAHGNEAIHKIVDSIVAEEDTQNPAIIFAEIAHLPESRIGNILLHPAFRKYEIPFLAKSSVAIENQITLQDLYISVQNNKVILRSKRLNKQVIPRLSSAHNYSARALPIYQFLGDLQLQGKQAGIYFNWGALERLYKFLPRVTYKNCIVNAATWHFDKKDIEAIKSKTGSSLLDEIIAFKQQWKLPALVVLADSDNELLINFDDLLMINIWLDAVKNRNSFILKEFLGATKNSSIKDIHGNTYCNQFVATLLKLDAAYKSTINEKKSNVATIQQNFSIGSEWLYFKIYCGVKLADTILANALYTLVNTLLEQRNINSFFFIRYNDPHFHLRIRFKVTDVEDIGVVIKLFHESIKPYEEDKAVWKVQLDTYKRELDRYGFNTITQTENIFFYDSMAFLQMLQHHNNDEREQVRWLWAIRGIDDLLNDFNFTTIEKYTLVEQIKNSFHVEYNADKFLRDQLSNKYRNNRKRVEDILDREKDEESDLKYAIDAIKEKSKNNQSIVIALKKMEIDGLLSVHLNSLLTSYIHMLVNRIVSANPRLHELVIYDILFTYYKSSIAREKYSTLNK